MTERLQKYLARCGVASRRAAEELILDGQISVNGQVLKKLGVKIDPDLDEVRLGKKTIKPASYVYYLLNKPIGFVATARDPHAKKIVTNLVPKSPRVFPVGRLDKDSSGLLVLTNDGDFAYRMTHPKFEKEKEYIIKSKIKNLSRAKSRDQKSKNNEIIKNLKNGIKLGEGVARADKVTILPPPSPSPELGEGWGEGDIVEFSITIHQGWNRQIRRMCDAVGLEVIDLKRVRIGKLVLGNLSPGKWRALNVNEINNI